jgi:hypothetical protein
LYEIKAMTDATTMMIVKSCTNWPTSIATIKQQLSIGQVDIKYIAYVTKIWQLFTFLEACIMEFFCKPDDS